MSQSQSSEAPPISLIIPTGEDTKKWDPFLDLSKKGANRSMVGRDLLDIAEKLAKALTYVVTFIVVLGCAALSKGTLLFMTSQIADDVTRPVCEGPNGPYDRYEVSLEPAQKIAWMWTISFAFFVPQVATFLRSLRILVFKSWQKPDLVEFLLAFITESLQTLGLALLVLKVLPNLNVVKGAMLTNAVCLIPAIFSLISRYKKEDDQEKSDPYALLRTILDVLSIAFQASALIIWPVLCSDGIDNWTHVYLIPLSLTLISSGWWKNYASEDSVLMRNLLALGKGYMEDVNRPSKKWGDENKRYFVYLFLSIWKCALFFGLMFVWPPDGVGRYAMFDDFVNAFADRQLNTTPTGIQMGDGVTTISVYGLTPIWIFLVNAGASYLCYAFAKFACKVYIHRFSYALPTILATPATVTVLIAMVALYLKNPCTYYGHIPVYLFYNVPHSDDLVNLLVEDHVWIWSLWLLSQIWITIHIWTPTSEKFAVTERLFVRPMYDPFLIDQDVALNRQRDHDDDQTGQIQEAASGGDDVTRIYVCGTMWHEEKDEMMTFLKSIMRLDSDQSSKRLAKMMKYHNCDYYELHAHIFFDDAFEHVPKNEPRPQINVYVKRLIQAVGEAACEVLKMVDHKLPPPRKYCTPYGGRLVWTLPGKNELTVHLKDKKRIRAKKRWSQVMYMYYILGHRLMALDMRTDRRELRSLNTYILALDGDIDFRPKALHLLLELMKKNKKLGAACGRIHPTGSGPMVWYQMFEYSIGHWLQKATEHEIGCVLCSPGCFSLFRGEALMDVSVLNKYASESTKALHFVQYDQGEDRWLCTLLLQRGYRVEYSAASDSYTHCPEGFGEFYNQRRRWIPSTLANIFDLLSSSKETTKKNDSISYLYVLYHSFLVIGTALGPGMIFLILVGVCVSVLNLDPWLSLFLNLVPVSLFVMVCVFAQDKTQLLVAGALSGMYALVMIATLIGIFLQIATYGALAPTSLFCFIVAGQIIFTALLHPKEFNRISCVLVYYIAIPSMFMLLIIYSVLNMNNVSWGTREETVAVQEDAPAAPSKKEGQVKARSLRFFRGGGNVGCFTCSIECMCCARREIPIKDERTVETNGDEVLEIGPETNQTASKSQTPSSIPRRRRTSSTGRPESQASERNAPEGVAKEEAWIYDSVLQEGKKVKIPKGEETFFKELIEKYLKPVDNTDDKVGVEKELKILRDKVALAFFMINAVFVIVLFLLTLSRDRIHIKWPLEVNINFTFVHAVQEVVIYKEYLQLEPIGIIFLLGFALILLVQFVAMLNHRFRTFSQIISNTSVNSKEISNNDPVRIIEYYQTGNDDDEDDDEVDVKPERRKTVALLDRYQMKPVEKFTDYESALKSRLDKLGKNGKSHYKGPYSWKAVETLIERSRQLNTPRSNGGASISNRNSIDDEDGSSDECNA